MYDKSFFILKQNHSKLVVESILNNNHNLNIFCNYFQAFVGSQIIILYL